IDPEIGRRLKLVQRVEERAPRLPIAAQGAEEGGGRRGVQRDDPALQYAHRSFGVFRSLTSVHLVGVRTEVVPARIPIPASAILHAPRHRLRLPLAARGAAEAEDAVGGVVVGLRLPRAI